jgi:hypothetical protein
MKDWVPLLLVILAVVGIVSCSIIFGGCNEVREFKRLRTTCRKMCKQKQDNNVGATFFYEDLEATFGECKCHARNGDVKKFYISNKDVRERE